MRIKKEGEREKIFLYKGPKKKGDFLAKKKYSGSLLSKYKENFIVISYMADYTLGNISKKWTISKKNGRSSIPL